MFDVGHFVANADIRPGRVVKLVGPFKVEEATGTSASTDRSVVGVAVVWSAKPKGFIGEDKAALAGQEVRVYQDGEVGLALASTAINAGDLLIAEDSASDARVKPIPAFNAAGSNEKSYVAVGQALHSAAANEYVRFRVRVDIVYNKE
jgi:hypothetical protein